MRFLSFPLFFSAFFLGAVPAGSAATNNPRIMQTNQPPAGNSEITPMIGHEGSHAINGGARYNYRLLRHGFIKPINNSVALDFGGFLQHDFNDGVDVILSGGMRWDFHVSDDWSVFPLFELQVRLVSGRLVPNVAAGGLYHVDDYNAIRLQLDALLAGQIGWVMKFKN